MAITKAPRAVLPSSSEDEELRLSARRSDEVSGDDLLWDPMRPLAHAVASGDPEAATVLVRQIGELVVRLVRKVLGFDHPDVDDVAQESLLAVLSALRQFRGESTVLHFVYRVTLRTALGARRRMRAQRRSGIEAPLLLDQLQDPKVSPYGDFLARQRQEIVRELLDDLSEPIAEALALHLMLGHSVEEMAASLGLSQHTVWSRLRLGKQALRRRLSSNGGLKELLESGE